MLTLQLLPMVLAVCRLAKDTDIPSWALKNDQFFSITRTADELSVVCLQAHIPDSITCEKNWRAFKVVGPLDFALTGILYSIARPLAEHKISIFAISTYDTDYILVKEKNIEQATAVLKNWFTIS